MPNLAQMKALLEDAKAAYKAQFTPGFYHGSPSPNIKAFDSTKGTKPPEWHTPGVTFVTKNVDFAHDYVPTKATIEKMVGQPDQYMTGATVYPVSVNLGKHFDPATPESQQVVADYIAKLNRNAMPDELEVKPGRMMDKLTDPINNWGTIEHPQFLQHLRDTGHDSFAVTEAGVPNVGVLKPQNIRGKFAAFNPEDAESTDFMKAEGGRVGYAAGGGVLKELAHAVSIPFTHFSPKTDLTVLDPRKYGTGMKGAEAARLANAADIAPRSYFYHGESIVPESGVGGNKYTGVSQNSYPISKDPGDFYTKSRTNDPYLMQMGITQHSPEHTINNMERMIKDAGYSGYHTDTGTGVLFQDTPVVKAQ